MDCSCGGRGSRVGLIGYMNGQEGNWTTKYGNLLDLANKYSVEVTKTIRELRSQLEQVTKERDRLKRGDFTTEEFQNLCHNIGVQAGFEAFADGCEAYQKQLFGRCRKGSTT